MTTERSRGRRFKGGTGRWAGFQTKAWLWVSILTCPLLASILSIPLAGRAQTASPGIVILDSRVTHTNFDPAGELQLLDLLNKTRSQHNLPLLVMDAALRSTARTHSRDMAVQGYFGHPSLSGQSFIERVGSVVRSGTLVGENVVIAQTVVQANTAFAASPGHSKNMLEPRFHRVGIGVATAGQLGLTVTEDFAE